ncbi:MAG TPA: hypothetical protein DIW37_17065 [Chryseobacterium sp.]|nr:hypothetical protein [Chryseobacterium sp.]
MEVYSSVVYFAMIQILKMIIKNICKYTNILFQKIIKVQRCNNFIHQFGIESELFSMFTDDYDKKIFSLSVC